MSRVCPAMIPSLKKLLGAAVMTAVCGAVQADDLMQVFDLAVNNDPQIRQARATYNAQHSVLDQGRSYLLPTISATAKTSRDTSGVDGTPATGGIFHAPEHNFANGYNSRGYSLSLRQAVLNFQAWYAFKSAQKSDQVASLTLARAEQDLIIRVATAYFDVLRSQANLTSFNP